MNSEFDGIKRCLIYRRILEQTMYLASIIRDSVTWRQQFDLASRFTPEEAARASDRLKALGIDHRVMTFWWEDCTPTEDGSCQR